MILNLNQKKENILNVEYNLQKGLTFSWNFKGMLSKDTYFRHLFLLSSHNHVFLQQTVQLICSKIKPGDFVACIYQKNNNISSKIRWIEKTSTNLTKINLSEMEPLSPCNQSQALEFLGSETVGYNNPVMVNILIDNKKLIEPIKKQVKGLRIEGQFPFHVNFFSDFDSHNIHISKGFNEISTTQYSTVEVGQIYKTLISQSALLNAQIQICSPQIQLSTRNDDIWESMDFNRVRRFYYGPSIHYNQDFINFFEEAFCKEGGNFQMTIELELTLCSGKKLRAEKNIIVAMETLRLYSLTRCDSECQYNHYEFSKAIDSRTYPYGSQSSLGFVKLKSIS